MLAQLMKSSLAGLVMLGRRWTLVFVTCIVFWGILDALDPCLHRGSPWLEPPECSVASVVERTLSQGETFPLHAVFTAIIALIIVAAWSITKLVWQETKPGTHIGHFSRPVAVTVRYGVVLAICIGINEVVANFGECLRDLLGGPSFVVGCYIFRHGQSSVRHDMLAYYLPPVAMAFVLVTVCSLFDRRWQ